MSGVQFALEVVLDPVELLAGRVDEPDRAHEGEHVAAGAAGSHAGVEPVAVDVQGAEDVADPVLAVVCRAQPLGTLARAQPAPWIGLRLIGPI